MPNQHFVHGKRDVVLSIVHLNIDRRRLNLNMPPFPLTMFTNFYSPQFFVKQNISCKQSDAFSIPIIDIGETYVNEAIATYLKQYSEWESKASNKPSI